VGNSIGFQIVSFETISRKSVSMWKTGGQALLFFCTLLFCISCSTPRMPELTELQVSDLKKGQKEFELLAQQTASDPQRYDLVKQGNLMDHIGSILSHRQPAELAALAIWAERKDPWFQSGSLVYREVFGLSINLLGQDHDQAAKQALGLVKRTVIADGFFDGHLAEEIEEAEHHQIPEQRR
jgi:hypothetical protein